MRFVRWPIRVTSCAKCKKTIYEPNTYCENCQPNSGGGGNLASGPSGPVGQAAGHYFASNCLSHALDLVAQGKIHSVVPVVVGGSPALRVNPDQAAAQGLGHLSGSVVHSEGRPRVCARCHYPLNHCICSKIPFGGGRSGGGGAGGSW